MAEFRRMGYDIINEFSRIRTTLIPQADRLIEETRNLPLEESFLPQTRSDIEELRLIAIEFRKDAEFHFPESPKPGTRGKNPESRLRKSRHDTRNRLNKLFQLVHLLSISEDLEEEKVLLDPIAENLETCLSILSRELPDSAEVELIPPPPAEEDVRHQDPGRILIVDDDENNRDLLSRLLEPTGHHLHFAENGKEAVEKIDDTIYDAVLLDIEMPEMDGFEVLAALRQTGHLRNTPVIVVTGRQEERDAVRCIEIGAEDFLSRPIRPALLMARLNASLEKKRLREQALEQHFTPKLARELARYPDPMKQLKPKVTDVSVLFCDIRGFSSISENQSQVTNTIEWLGGVMGEFSTIVIQHGGVLVDYTGDELLAMWGAPSEQPDHADLACSTALSIMDSLEKLNRKWEPVIGSETRVGIGINSGEALVGNIGTHRKFKYGPLGTVVNVASRVQGATKYLKTPLLATGSTVSALSDQFRTRRLGKVRVQNIQQTVELHELARADVDESWVALAEKFETALSEFEKQNLQGASDVLNEVIRRNPMDGPSLELNLRVAREMVHQQEQKEFSPIWELPGK